MGEFEDTLTFRLFARPSFTEGLARLFDFAGSLQVYNRSKTGNEADFKALEADWTMVGRDIREAMSRYEQEASE